jgi:transposase-like protein
MFARGCSTRDVAATFAAEDGTALFSKSAVAERTERLWEEYEAFATRDLSEINLLYLFIDGMAERITPGFKREAVLCAWAITWETRKVLLHIAPGRKESTEYCREFIEEMQRRGLSAPLLVATDGAAGLIRAVEDGFPPALRQRCLAHKMRNIAAKLPEDIRAKFQAAAQAS